MYKGDAGKVLHPFSGCLSFQKELLFAQAGVRWHRALVLFYCYCAKEGRGVDEKKSKVRRLGLATFVLLLPVAIGLPSAYATTLDLTTTGAWGILNEGIFQQYTEGAGGSGNIDAFVRIQRTGVEQGYNTDYRPVEFDENTSASFTHSLLLSEVPIVTNGGTSYREFLVDINQDGQNLLSLDGLEIALHASGNLIGYSTIFASPIYDMDAGEDNWILLDYSLNAGSGAGDMLAYIPDSFFMDEFGAYLNDYVYLYSRFGENFGANDGFEEWAHGADGPIIPEPATLLLLGLGGLALLRKRRA